MKVLKRGRVLSKDRQILLIAGEKSGEEHALSFVPELSRLIPGTHFFGVGGDALEKSGMEILYHLKDFSSWGFSEVIGKIPFYFKALKRLEKEVDRRNTKVAILVDFQDFNLRLAKKLSKKGVKVLYYVAPQAWAWKEWRAQMLEECTHSLFTIIPFEEQWFRERGVKRVVGISHPLFHHYEKRLKPELLGVSAKDHRSFRERVRILLLPGSRNFEVKGLLFEYFQAIELLQSEFMIEVGMVRSSNVNEKIYEPFLSGLNRIYESEELPEALEWADFSLAASGTVTLSCAIFQVPTVVSYRTSLFNEFVYYTFIKYKGFISLANIVHQESLFPELIQNQASAYNMASALRTWLTSRKEYEKIKTKLKQTMKLIDKSETDIPEMMGKVIKESYGPGIN